eukprot:GHVS01020777.1.p1 GENE.GHVS01020777.1~~GHVS01020777.1.p1  ORF type:complete len:247 (+),score=39.46 GHVS01020777.1:95-835(+)
MSFLFRSSVKCDGSTAAMTSSPPLSTFDAFPEAHVPLSSSMDAQKHQLYRWGSIAKSEEEMGGSRAFSECLDSRNHSSIANALPFPLRRSLFHPNSTPEADRINTQYSAMITDNLPEGGFEPVPRFSSKWEGLLSYHRGLYDPRANGAMRSEEEVRLAVGEYGDKVNADNPKSACKFIDIEHFRCREVHQHRMDPRGANEKCLKWQMEFDRCLWDEEKLSRGISYIEDRRHKKHRAYIGAPDYQFS